MPEGKVGNGVDRDKEMLVRLDQEVRMHCNRIEKVEDECANCRSALNGKFDRIQAQIEGLRNDFRSRSDTLHARITATQIKVAGAFGAAVVIAALLSTVATAAINHMVVDKSEPAQVERQLPDDRR